MSRHLLFRLFFKTRPYLQPDGTVQTVQPDSSGVRRGVPPLNCAIAGSRVWLCRATRSVSFDCPWHVVVAVRSAKAKNPKGHFPPSLLSSFLSSSMIGHALHARSLVNAATELGGDRMEPNRRGISQAVAACERGRPAAAAEHNSCLNSQRAEGEGERGRERGGGREGGRSRGRTCVCVCGERATVASAAIVFPAPVAGAALPSSLLPSIPFFLSLVSRLGSLSLALSLPSF